MTTAFAVTVMGSRSCGEWVEARKTGGYSEIAVQGWLGGYLSGLAVESGRDILASTDLSSLSLWMDKHCKDNPLRRIDGAGYFLFIELERKIKK